MTQKSDKIGSFAKVSKIFFASSLIFVLMARVSPGATQLPSNPFPDEAKEPWHIAADNLSFDRKTGAYRAEGNVVIQKKDIKLSADFAEFFSDTLEIAARGNVSLISRGDILTGSRVEIDLKNETGTIYQGGLFLNANHFHIKGDRIQKTGKKSYNIQAACLTSCDGDSPAWKITGRNLNVTVDGYGTVSHATLWAKNIPVFYTPFLIFPAKVERQSGLLAPQMGYSERKWEEYIQPFYWAINQSSDATFYFHHMERRGEKLGLQYRYILDDTSKGAVMADFLNDLKIDDGARNSGRYWGFDDDTALRPNSDRYWFRMKHDHRMPDGFSAALDIDWVSDQDYLHEFRDKYTGFEATNRYFVDHFSRELDEDIDPVRVNSLRLSKIWMNYSLNAQARWYDNVVKRRQDLTDTTLQRLPFIEFDASKQQILSTPFYFNLDSEYTYFYRQDGSKGHRADLYPRFYLPYAYKNVFFLEPSLGFRQTLWHPERPDSGAQPGNEKNGTHFRGVYDFGLDISSEIYRVYETGSGTYDKIKHTLQPAVFYQYSPEQDQGKYHFFDPTDRIEGKNLLTYSLTNTFTARFKNNTPGQDRAADYSYRQFFRFKLEQSYDINKHQENAPEPFSPVSGELQIFTSPYFSFQADGRWSLYENRFSSYSVSTKLSDQRGDEIWLEHLYAGGLGKSIYARFNFVLTRWASGYLDYERNLLDGKDIRTGLGLRYKESCWSVDLLYSKEDQDRRYGFMINLYGLGEMGI
ncbi:MAG: LPS assembly protein LptD [Desulfobacterales bacterium]|nr:LPS assembly protein LptD [Desulfobacterales bacterium]